MQFHQLMTIGSHHTNHCEDYLLSAQTGAKKWLFAVLDGCTMGNESYFASALCGKVLRKIAKEQYFLDFRQPNELTPEQELKFILQKLFETLRQIKNQLMLDKYDLLTTLILAIYHENTQQGIVMAVGDGVVVIDGVITEFEQDNQPDYLGYHLDENFETWFGNQTQLIRFGRLEDMSISTDGIFTFDRFDHQKYPETEDPLNYLLFDKTSIGHEQMFHRKMIHLVENCGLKPTDDLAIIRLIKL